MKRLLLLAFLVALVVELHAQSFTRYKRNRSAIVSFGTGVTSYFGDLNNPGDIIDSRLNVNVGLQAFFLEWLALRTELMYYQLEGSDAESDRDGRRVRNLSFTSSNLEFNVAAMANLVPNGLRFYQRNDINLYGFLGVGFTYYNPKAELDGTKYALRPLQTEGTSYGNIALIVPAGVGVKVKVGPFFNIALEGGYRLSFSDYLDDVSTVYIDNNSFTDPVARALADRRPEIGLGLAEAGDKRGNPDRDDGYLVLNLKIEYYLPSHILNFNTLNARRRGYRSTRRRYR